MPNVAIRIIRPFIGSMKIKKGDINMKCSIPVYRQSGTTALERGEIAQFRQSYQANILCKEAIAKAISNHWDGLRLHDGPVCTKTPDA